MSGLHTLTDGLTNPDATASSIGFQGQSTPTVALPTTSSHSSIFNNPNPSSSRSQDADSRRINASRSSVTLNAATSPALSSSSSTVKNTRTNGSDSGITKEVDDPSTPTAGVQGSKHFLTAASASSRYTARTTTSWRGSDTLSLEDFIYKRGFLEGACSDITIIAFGKAYPLHRLILDRSPFFSSCFNGGPWKESSSSEISITPELSDPNITKHAFDLALARLYGHSNPAEEEQHALPLLATASFLDLQDLAESCIISLLKNLKTSNIAKILRFVTNSFYGPLTDRLLDSAKALLYRDGWEMEMSEWDGIPGDFAADIIGFDGFYVPDEWLRYCFVKEIIDWRLQKIEKERESENCDEDAIEEQEADLKPLKDLLENGIYYMHMSFKQLQKIKDDKDFLGRPVVNCTVVQNALWDQSLLRQKVLEAPLDSPELGITDKYVVETTESPNGVDTPSSSVKSVSPARSRIGRSPTPNSTDDGPGKDSKKRYFIPTEDSTIIIGDHMAVPEQTTAINQIRNGRPVSNSQDPTAGSISGNGNTSAMTEKDAPYIPREEMCYSTYPPFRFSAEFRNVRALKEKKRVYSQTVFYAGSHWNIYIQKVRSPKNVQLGVYLHRAKDRESALNIAATGYAHGLPGGLPNESTVLLGNADLDSSATTRSGSRPQGSSEFDASDDTLNEAAMGRTHSSGGASVRASLEAGSSADSMQPPQHEYYTDSRPQVQTYFKIFSPSKKGKVLSMFSSHPDSFNFSQSWGWKSSSLILDESLIAEGDKESRLRFMVVLGNV